jgi:uncharacterized coiled-coil protein SlyX
MKISTFKRRLFLGLYTPGYTSYGETDEQLSQAMEYRPNPEGYTTTEINHMIEEATHDIEKAQARLERLLNFTQYQETHQRIAS